MPETLQADPFTVGDTTLLDNSPSLLSPQQTYLPIVKPEDKFPSQIYTSEHDINNLIASAAPLFSLLSKLRGATYEEDLDELHAYLSHEIRAFEAAALQHGYYSEMIILARYAICSTLDETILHAKWSAPLDWEKHSLLLTFHGELQTDNRFYQILEKLLNDPKPHLDILEFYYTCLSMGFMGEYHNKPQLRTAYEELFDQVYKAIRLERGDFEKRLTPLIKRHTTVTPQQLVRSNMSLWIVAILTSTLIVTMYSGFRYMLSSSTSPLYQTVANIQKQLGSFE